MCAQPSLVFHSWCSAAYRIALCPPEQRPLSLAITIFKPLYYILPQYGNASHEKFMFTLWHCLNYVYRMCSLCMTSIAFKLNVLTTKHGVRSPTLCPPLLYAVTPPRPSQLVGPPLGWEQALYPDHSPHCITLFNARPMFVHLINIQFLTSQPVLHDMHCCIPPPHACVSSGLHCLKWL